MKHSTASLSCSKIFLRAGKSHVMLKNGTEHAESLFVALLDTISRPMILKGWLFEKYGANAKH